MNDSEKLALSGAQFQRNSAAVRVFGDVVEGFFENQVKLAAEFGLQFELFDGGRDLQFPGDASRPRHV